MHIGTRIKQLMKDRGVSTKKMADHCGISPGAVSNWFSTGRISKENLVKAAAVLNVTMSELITGDEFLPVETPSGYSVEALALAWLLDQIPNRLAKTRANHAATTAILAVINEPGAAPTRKPAATENPKKLPA